MIIYYLPVCNIHLFDIYLSAVLLVFILLWLLIFLCVMFTRLASWEVWVNMSLKARHAEWGQNCFVDTNSFPSLDEACPLTLFDFIFVDTFLFVILRFGVFLYTPLVLTMLICSDVTCFLSLIKFLSPSTRHEPLDVCCLRLTVEMFVVVRVNNILGTDCLPSALKY